MTNTQAQERLVPDASTAANTEANTEASTEANTEARTDAATTEIDTLVVGAGVAGLTAARFLVRGGAQRVVVLEARNRVGGRTWTEEADLGASWIHGVNNNPLTEVVRAFGMAEHEFTVGSYQVDGRPIVNVGPDGRRLSGEEADAFAADVHAADRAIERVVAAYPPGRTYADAVEEALAARDWADERRARVREFMHHRSEEQYGVDAALLDAHGLDDDQVDGDEIVFPNGYAELAGHLAEGLDVRLGHEVTRVDWFPCDEDGEGSATITTSRQTFIARRCIITVPVGVLKSEAFRIDPPLPEPAAGALTRLEMNDFEKVFLTFPERFWEDGVYAIRRQGDAARWWHSWYDVSAVQGAPTLLTFAAGECAQQTRTWSDQEIAESVLERLREIYGPDVPAPRDVRVTRWRDDPYARGSYAYMVVGGEPEDHDRLATPIGGTRGEHAPLHLAGEATWTDDPATVTAALRSGHRVAERILGRALPYALLSEDRPAP